jgi:hypothetical protein
MSDIFTMFSMNENGMFTQAADVNAVIQDALSDPPFGFQDVFIYSHGWWTKADDAMALYSRYIVEFNKTLINIGGTLTAPPVSSLR